MPGSVPGMVQVVEPYAGGRLVRHLFAIPAGDQRPHGSNQGSPALLPGAA